MGEENHGKSKIKYMAHVSLKFQNQNKQKKSH